LKVIKPGRAGLFFSPASCVARESGPTLYSEPVILQVFFAAPETRVYCEKAQRHAGNLEDAQISIKSAKRELP